jgi:predicted HTH transcriptional regulator
MTPATQIEPQKQGRKSIAANAQHKAERELILQLVTKYPGMTTKTIAERSDIKTRAALQRLDSLRRGGKVTSKRGPVKGMKRADSNILIRKLQWFPAEN